MATYGYIRISKDNANGHGPEAQLEAIRRYCAGAGVKLTETFQDLGVSGRTTKRPELQRLLGQLGEGDVLVAAKLDRLSRSLLDFAELIERSQREGWSIAVLDVGVDLSTPIGRMVSGVLATFAQFEREMISERTTRAL